MWRRFGQMSAWVILAAAVPAFAQTTAQTPNAPAAPAGPLTDDTKSLFSPSWNSLQILGRVNSVSGDPARFQRYQDLRDGLLFTAARTERATVDYNVSAAADNVGWRDQRFVGNYERIGLFKLSGLWDQIPQFYSVDTRTPFTSGGEGVLLLDDAAQRAANLNVYPPIAPQFDLRERRDIGTVRVDATPTVAVDVHGGFTTTKHSGELPWGADFGFGNDNEVALPYRSRTNDFDLGAEWTNQRSMIRAGYTGSWFNNQDDTLTWDNPLLLTDTPEVGDTPGGPGRGRTALWPSNSLQTLSTAGYAKFSRRTQISGSLAYGWWSNNEAPLPFTINRALPQLTLPRATAEAEANTLSTNVNLVSRPRDEWRLSARIRHYGYNNNTPETAIPQYVSYDTEISDSLTGGPHLFAHSRTNFDADATWTALQPLAFTVGYTNNHNGYDHRTFESTNENVLRLQADAVGSQWVTFRAHYEYGSRSGSGLDEQSLTQIGEYAEMRHYDLAERTRNRFVGQVDVIPTERLVFSVSSGIGTDDFDDSYFGLQDSAFRNVSFSVDYTLPRGVGVGTTYNYERYTGLQQSRSASPGTQQQDPTRDWRTDSKETVHYVSFYIEPPRIGRNTEARFSYEYAHARGNYVYEVGSGLPPPSQLPQTFNKLQDLRLDVRHRLSGRLAARFSYMYEPSRIFDFAFDPSVINSIVQPSSLVLGYTYRPYTAHTGLFGLMYYW